ncbi:patatin-like phospholipase family protein [Bosea sp. RCC_152_1]|uniref:patatin-like phospholipase family protein n=1 Tax=Bosea sp. RCC_152_1 TaxID=3239228 RepID=UPI00352384AB
MLSNDGGGIRGVFPAAILAGLEETLTGGKPISDCFDLIVGTSTGGTLALGLSAGFDVRQLRDLSKQRGRHIFIPTRLGGEIHPSDAGEHVQPVREHIAIRRPYVMIGV